MEGLGHQSRLSDHPDSSPSIVIYVLLSAFFLYDPLLEHACAKPSHARIEERALEDSAVAAKRLARNAEGRSREDQGRCGVSKRRRSFERRSWTR